jgi:hypothetical protein
MARRASNRRAAQEAAGIQAENWRIYFDFMQDIMKEVRDGTSLPDVCAGMVVDYVGVPYPSRHRITITIDNLISPTFSFLVFETSTLRGVFDYVSNKMGFNRNLLRFYRQSNTDPNGSIEIRNSELCVRYKGDVIVCKRRLHLA